MKFKTNVNIFGLGAGVEFEAEHTEFLQNHVDGGKISLVLADEDPGDAENGSEGGTVEAGGTPAPAETTEPAESVSKQAKKAVLRAE